MAVAVMLLTGLWFILSVFLIAIAALHLAGNLSIWPILILVIFGQENFLSSSELMPVFLGFGMMALLYLSYRFAEKETDRFMEFLAVALTATLVLGTMITTLGGGVYLLLKLGLGLELPLWTIVPFAFIVLGVWLAYASQSPK